MQIINTNNTNPIIDENNGIFEKDKFLKEIKKDLQNELITENNHIIFLENYEKFLDKYKQELLEIEGIISIKIENIKKQLEILKPLSTTIDKGFFFVRTKNQKSIFCHISNYNYQDNCIDNKKRKTNPLLNNIKQKINNGDNVVLIEEPVQTEKGLNSNKWCFESEINTYLSKKYDELICSEKKSLNIKLAKELLDIVNPFDIGIGIWYDNITNYGVKKLIY